MKRIKFPIVLSSMIALVVGTQSTPAIADNSSGLQFVWYEAINALKSTYKAPSITDPDVVKMLQDGWRWITDGYYVKAGAISIHVKRRTCTFEYDINSVRPILQKVANMSPERLSHFHLCMKEKMGWEKMAAAVGQGFIIQDIPCLSNLGVVQPKELVMALSKAHNTRLAAVNKHCGTTAAAPCIETRVEGFRKDSNDFLYRTEAAYKAEAAYECDHDACTDGTTLDMPAGHVFEGEIVNYPARYSCLTGLTGDFWYQVGEPENNKKPGQCVLKTASSLFKTSNEYLYPSAGSEAYECDDDSCNGTTLDMPAGHVFEGNLVNYPAKYECVTELTGDFWKQIERGNSRIQKPGDRCKAENASVAKINSEGNCAAIECVDGYELARYDNGQSKGYCIKTQPKAENIVLEPSEAQDALLKVDPIDAPDIHRLASADGTSASAAADRASASASDKRMAKLDKEQKNLDAERRCIELGANLAEMAACKKDPEAWGENKLNKMLEQKAKADNEATCKNLGATSGQNKTLCMENPVAYSSAKSQCESMNATGTAFNKCVQNPAAYKAQYDKEMTAQAAGAKNVREYEKSLEQEAEIQRLEQALKRTSV